MANPDYRSSIVKRSAVTAEEGHRSRHAKPRFAMLHAGRCAVSVASHQSLRCLFILYIYLHRFANSHEYTSNQCGHCARTLSTTLTAQTRHILSDTRRSKVAFRSGFFFFFVGPSFVVTANTTFFFFFSEVFDAAADQLHSYCTLREK